MAYAVDGQRYDSKFDYITQGFQQEAELNPTDKETTKAEEDQGNLVRKRHQIQDEREGPNPTFPPKDNPDAVPTDFLARRQRKAEGFFDKIRLAQNDDNVTELHPGTSQTLHPPLQIDVLGGGVGVHSGPGAARMQKKIDEVQDISKSLPKTGKAMSEYQAATNRTSQQHNWIRNYTLKTNPSKLPANENIKTTEFQKDIDHFSRFMVEQPELFKYYRGFYEQKGGKDWERWQLIEGEAKGRFLDEEEGIPTISPVTQKRLDQAVESARIKGPQALTDKAAMKFEDIILAPGNWMAKAEQKIKSLLKPKKEDDEK